MKNYIGFVNDHSGSMGGQLAIAAAADYNAISGAIVKAATTEMQDTIVSVVDIGTSVRREVTFSNPHVLKPITRWEARGGTPLYEGLLDLIKLHETAPDLNKEEVSFVIFTTTDGEANYDDAVKYKPLVKAKIADLARTGRWTFVFRVPRGARHQVDDLGVPSENIQEWDTTTEGMKVSTVQTQAAVTQFYTQRSAGAKSSNTFYAQAAAVDTSKLVEGSLVLYWAEKGRPMTQADLDKYAGQNNVAAAPAVLQGLPVAPTNKPTPSPIPVTKKAPDLTVVNGKKVLRTFNKREDAREYGRSHRLANGSARFVQDIRDFPGMALEGGKRWFLFE